MKRSRQNKRDPTGSQRKINAYEIALTNLFRTYKARVTELIKTEDSRNLEAKRPIKVDLKTVTIKLDEIEKEVLYDPVKKITRVKIPEAYNAGGMFGSIQLGAPYEVRKDAWKRIGDLVEKNNLAFEKIGAETGGRIRAVIADGLVKEKTLSDITREIVRICDNVGIARATVMARTEIMEAVNAGIHDRYQAAGVEKERWLTALDEKTCEVCEGNDGKIIPDEIDERPPAHPNCRCTIIPVIEIPGAD